MPKDLVIVESPAKARTIEKFLGGKFVAKASMGHVRDLPRRKMGVDVDENGFTPTYTVPADKRKIVSDLTKAAKNANTVYLATDPDREGEAISWHLIEAAKIDHSKVKRVVFHEITERAVNEAFDNPRELDYDLVDAQQARRILDRLVGYDLSPVLWMKVKRGLSAGRVQSVALRIIVDREREIDSFKPEEFWSLEALFPVISKGDEKVNFTAKLNGIKGVKGRFRISDSNAVKNILADLDDADYRVDLIKKKDKRNRPSAPFITSTLQQEAWRKLRFTSRKTMVVAQQLYEGISLGERGSTGLITYMRTDSTNVASSAISEVREYISSKFGQEYHPKSPKLYTKKVKGAQEAHEAIRPTSIWDEPSSVQQFLNRDQSRLYDLIWKRMLASQMNDAVYDSTTLEISASCVGSDKKYDFRANGSVMKFPGYRKIYIEGSDDSSQQNSEETMVAVAKTKKPVIISMGFGGNRMKINKIFKNNKKFWLYCISKYPTDIKEIDFKLMQRHDGFSDHTEDSVAPILYALKSKHQKKIKFLEKHVSITESSGPDKPFSMEIGDFAVLIKNIRSVPDLKIKI